LVTLAIAAPLSNASAAKADDGGVIEAASWGGLAVAFIDPVGPSLGQTAAIIGPTVITTAPSMFVNVNNQTDAGGSLAGVQLAP
jgi:hypothetical protein